MQHQQQAATNITWNDERAMISFRTGQSRRQQIRKHEPQEAANVIQNHEHTIIGTRQEILEQQQEAVAVAADNGNDENFMLSKGLSLVGFDEKRQRVTKSQNEERFQAFYGVGSKPVSALYNDLKTANPEVFDKDRYLEYFFMTLNWLKLYDTEWVLAGRWCYHEETCRPKIKEIACLIQNLKEQKIKWGDFADETFICSVDGVHCRIYEARKDPGSKWYSHKSNSAGVVYELGIAIRSNRLVWIRGPFPASTHDITIFRGGKKKETKDPEALQFQIPEGKKMIGDSGYKGESEKVTITREGDSDNLKKFKA
jgi:hypothetical protein